MLINRKQLIELFLSDSEDVSPEWIERVKRRQLKELSRYSAIELIEVSKLQWNWKLEIARSNTFLVTV
jgi:hypothetical protein